MSLSAKIDPTLKFSPDETITLELSPNNNKAKDLKESESRTTEDKCNEKFTAKSNLDYENFSEKNDEGVVEKKKAESLKPGPNQKTQFEESRALPIQGKQIHDRKANLK